MKVELGAEMEGETRKRGPGKDKKVKQTSLFLEKFAPPEQELAVRRQFLFSYLSFFLPC